jgi:hypothetical protein
MRPILIFLICIHSGCLHIERTTSHPIEGVLNDHTGSPISGTQVWAVCRMPGGLLEAPKNTSWGPAVTDIEGKFRILMTPVSMIQTGTIFDGSSKPFLLIVDRNRGCYMAISTINKKDLGFMKLTFPELKGRPIFDMIDELDPKDQEIALSYVHSP